MRRYIGDTIKELQFIIIGIAGLLTICQLLLVWSISVNTAIEIPIQMWIYSSDMLDFFLPILITAPFTWIIFYRNQSDFYHYVAVRTKLRAYLIGQFITIIAAAFLIVLLVNLVGSFSAMFFISPQHQMQIGEAPYQLPYLPLKLRVNNPVVFAVVASFWKALIAVILAFAGCIVAYTSSNIFVSSFAILVYVIIENNVSAALGLLQYNLITALSFGRLTDDSYNRWSMLVGPTILLLVALLVLWGKKLYGKWRTLT